jgi:hypothetical protein
MLVILQIPPSSCGHATEHTRRRLEGAAAASRKVWIFQRSGGAGAALHFQLFKGYAKRAQQIQIDDFIGISAASRQPARHDARTPCTP